MNIFMDIIKNSEKVNITVKNEITGQLIMLVYYDSTFQWRIILVLITVWILMWYISNKPF